MQTKRNELRTLLLVPGLAALSLSLAGCQSSPSIGSPQPNAGNGHLRLDIGFVTMRIQPSAQDQMILRLEARRCGKEASCEGVAISWVKADDNKSAQNRSVRRTAFS